MLKLFFILILLGIYNYDVIGQEKNSIELRGEVKGALSKEPLSFVHIKVKGKAIGVPTNNEGKFYLHLTSQAANDTLVISLIGYESKTVPVKELLAKDTHIFFLIEKIHFLEEVVIKAEDAADIIKKVTDRLKDIFPAEPFAFEGYYRNAYKEYNTYVRQVEVAFNGFDENFHHRSGHQIQIIKKRESADYRQFKWRQAQGNIPWHYLWHIRRQHHYFFTKKQYRNYDYTVEAITYFDREKVYKLKFALKDKSQRTAESWAFIRARDYAILEIGGKTTIINPNKFQLNDSLFMAYTGGTILVKYVEHNGKMYPSYSSSLYQHDVYDKQAIRQGSFDMNEEMFIHQIKMPVSYSAKKVFEQLKQAKVVALPVDSLFWKQYNKPVETSLSRAIEKDLAAQGKAASHTQTGNPESASADIPIAVQQLKTDFALFRSSLQEAHPSLYRYTQKEEMDSLFDITYQRLTKPLSEIEFYKLLTPILAKIRCGHTGSLLSKKYLDTYATKALFLPIQTKYLNNKLYIFKSYHSPDQIKEGHELVSINGLPIKEIVNQILPHLSADGYISSSKHQELAWNFVKLYSLYISQSDTFDIVTKNEQEKLEITRTPAISYESYLTWRSDSNEENKYRLLDSKTALLKVATFADIESQIFKEWAKNVFDDLAIKGISNLIVDLRDNRGGRDDYASYLLSFLVKAPFHYHLSLKAATNHFTFLSYTNQEESLNSLMSQIVIKDSIGGFILRNTHPTLNIKYPQANRFRGKVYFITNGNTFSAAADFAAIANELKIGEFIGEETGGALEGNTSNGEILLTLPNSGIRIGIPIFRIQNAVSNSYARGRGVIPKHITSYSIDDFIKNADVDLELIKNLILKD